MLAPRSRPTEHAEPSIDQHCDQMVHSMSMVGKNGGRLDEAQQHERGAPATEAKRRRVDIRDTRAWSTGLRRFVAVTEPPTRGEGGQPRDRLQSQVRLKTLILAHCAGCWNFRTSLLAARLQDRISSTA